MSESVGKAVEDVGPIQQFRGLVPGATSSASRSLSPTTRWFADIAEGPPSKASRPAVGTIWGMYLEYPRCVNLSIAKRGTHEEVSGGILSRPDDLLIAMRETAQRLRDGCNVCLIFFGLIGTRVYGSSMP